jgi:hypothetical protein
VRERGRLLRRVDARRRRSEKRTKDRRVSKMCKKKKGTRLLFKTHHDRIRLVPEEGVGRIRRARDRRGRVLVMRALRLGAQSGASAARDAQDLGLLVADPGRGLLEDRVNEPRRPDRLRGNRLVDGLYRQVTAAERKADDKERAMRAVRGLFRGWKPSRRNRRCRSALEHNNCSASWTPGVLREVTSS